MISSPYSSSSLLFYVFFLFFAGRSFLAVLISFLFSFPTLLRLSPLLFLFLPISLRWY
jgi:hypothetical protein